MNIKIMHKKTGIDYSMPVFLSVNRSSYVKSETI